MTKKRRFYELHMGPLVLDNHPSMLDICKKYIEKCRLYGYHYCVATIILSTWNPSYIRKIKFIKKECPANALRLHINTANPGSLLSLLRTTRRLAEIISAPGYNRKVLALASRDRRVDIVSLIPGLSPPLYSGDITYMEKTGKLVEIGIGHIDLGHPQIASKQLSHARTIVEKIKERVPIVATSAGSKEYTPRDPRSLIEFGAMFLNIKREKAAGALSDIVEEKIEVNRKKLMGKMPLEGVYIEEG